MDNLQRLISNNIYGSEWHGYLLVYKTKTEFNRSTGTTCIKSDWLQRVSKNKHKIKAISAKGK